MPGTPVSSPSQDFNLKMAEKLTIIGISNSAWSLETGNHPLPMMSQVTEGKIGLSPSYLDHKLICLIISLMEMACKQANMS